MKKGAKYSVNALQNGPNFLFNGIENWSKSTASLSGKGLLNTKTH